MSADHARTDAYPALARRFHDAESERLVKRFPRSQDLAFLRALALTRAGSLEAARAALGRAEELDPESPVGHEAARRRAQLGD